MAKELKDWFWVLAAIAMRLLQGVLIAQLAGPATMGLYLKILIVPTLAAKLGDLSVPLSISYYQRKGMLSARTALWRTLVHFIALAAIGFALTKLLATLPILDNDVQRAFSAFGLAIAIVSANEFLIGASQAILVAANRSAFYALATCSSLGFFGALLAALPRFRSYSGLIELRFLSFVVFLVSLIVLVLLIPQKTAGSDTGSSVGWRSQYGFAFRAYIGNVVKNISYRLDRLILMTVISNADFAFYNLAVMLRETLVSFSTSFGQFLLNKIIDNVHRKASSYRLFIKATLAFAALTGSGIGISMVIAPYFFPLVYGMEFAQTVPYWQILGWSVVFITLSGLSWYSLVAAGRPGQVSWAVFIESLLGLPIIYGLTTEFHAKGASWAILISSCLGFMVATTLALRTTHKSEASIISSTKRGT